MAQFVVGEIVTLDYEDLVNGVDLTDKISQAYGVDGVGVLTVKNVPGFVEARSRLLPLSREFASLPETVKEKYVHKESYYSFGWSHGKEKLQGKPDISKGSYYANPQFDKPIEDESIIAKYPSFVHPNIWPTEELPELAPAFKGLGEIIVNTGFLLARQCDRFVHANCPTYAPNRLEKVIRESLCCKARLLHYFPVVDVDVDAAAVSSSLSSTTTTTTTAITATDDATAAVTDAFSSWCGWHNDHGSLTGLCSAMYINEAGETVKNVDATAGLYVRNRKSELIKVNIPSDHIGFQIGETSQIHSGGFLQATPHAVRAGGSVGAMRGVSRETYAVFMEPMWNEPMNCPSGVDPAMAQSQSAAANLPKGVPPLGSRWRQFVSVSEADMEGGNGVENATAAGQRLQTFGEFTEATHKAYY